MEKTLKTIVRILEVTSCGNCKHLDDRWERAPWDCTEGGLKIRHRDKIHRNCPLDTKKDYLAANAPDQARFQPSPRMDGLACPDCGWLVRRIQDDGSVRMEHAYNCRRNQPNDKAHSCRVSAAKEA